MVKTNSFLVLSGILELINSSLPAYPSPPHYEMIKLGNNIEKDPFVVKA
jgi:hypothetical protein